MRESVPAASSLQHLRIAAESKGDAQGRDGRENAARNADQRSTSPGLTMDIYRELDRSPGEEIDACEARKRGVSGEYPAGID